MRRRPASEFRSSGMLLSDWVMNKRTVTGTTPIPQEDPSLLAPPQSNRGSPSVLRSSMRVNTSDTKSQSSSGSSQKDPLSSQNELYAKGADGCRKRVRLTGSEPSVYQEAFRVPAPITAYRKTVRVNDRERWLDQPPKRAPSINQTPVVPPIQPKVYQFSNATLVNPLPVFKAVLSLARQPSKSTKLALNSVIAVPVSIKEENSSPTLHEAIIQEPQKSFIANITELPQPTQATSDIILKTPPRKYDIHNAVASTPSFVWRTAMLVNPVQLRIIENEEYLINTTPSPPRRVAVMADLVETDIFRAETEEIVIKEESEKQENSKVVEVVTNVTETSVESTTHEDVETKVINDEKVSKTESVSSENVSKITNTQVIVKQVENQTVKIEESIKVVNTQEDIEEIEVVQNVVNQEKTEVITVEKDESVHTNKSVEKANTDESKSSPSDDAKLDQTENKLTDTKPERVFQNTQKRTNKSQFSGKGNFEENEDDLWGLLKDLDAELDKELEAFKDPSVKPSPSQSKNKDKILSKEFQEKVDAFLASDTFDPALRDSMKSALVK